jgi:hypothetical protein
MTDETPPFLDGPRIFAERVQKLIQSPGGMFRDRASTEQLLLSTAAEYTDLVSELDAGFRSVYGDNGALNVMLSAMRITHEVALLGIRDVATMIVADTKFVDLPQWQTAMREAQSINPGGLTPGMFAVIVGVQQRAIWEAAYELRSSTLGIAAHLLDLSVHGLLEVIAELELRALDIPTE